MGGAKRPRSFTGLPWRMAVAFCLAVTVVLALPGCGSVEPAPVDSRDGGAPVPAGRYRVRGGDTLYSIAFRRGLDYRTLARWNGIDAPYRIYEGQLLRVIPDAAQGPTPTTTASIAGAPAPARPPEPVSAKIGRVPAADAPGEAPRPVAEPAGATAPGPESVDVPASSGQLRWQWPLDGKVVQGFRQGDRTRQGVRIAGRAGQTVRAAEAGTVVYSGSGLKGYGNLIIVKHNDKFLSAYGFNRRLLVSEGQRVRRGQGVAEVGQASSGEHLLHFEIRRNGVAQDPLRYLPGSR